MEALKGIMGCPKQENVRPIKETIEGDSKCEKALLWEASSSSAAAISSTSTILSLRVFLSFVRVLVHQHSAHVENVV